ncbi:MAG TPA: hypothetical protein VFU23_08635, partial [Gemmatimonadales bacterium]|nr:hypothetical protein [Gemmatimonadales bacterium]
MPKKRVIAFGLHETEISAATQVLGYAAVTESFVVGDADDAEIAALRARGLVVKEVPEEEPKPVTRGGRVAFGAGGARLPRAAPAQPTTFYRVALRGPLLEEWRSGIQNAGGVIIEGLSPVALRVKIGPANLAAVAALPFVAGPPEPLEREAATGRTFAAEGLAPSNGVTPIDTYDVLLTEPAALPPLLLWLKEHRVAVAGSGGSKVRIYALKDDPVLEEISGLSDWVKLVEPWVAPKLFNDLARTLLGLDGAGPAPAAPFPYDGTDQIVAIADT